ncbi:glyoxalase [Aequorivita marina]|uniref:glyoxalase n=1 Tax=Aequorivita marina TaxID=3073654 RepID=UPI00287678EC|nr:glyoxalase [Aequorivita sp. S2608]MDS1297756.1 glyoxalase [Aequorivita sp. S2608]
MDTRESLLLKLRPDIPSAKITASMSADECFQNQTLRPVIKLQHNLLLAAFKNYIKKHKDVFYDLNVAKKMDYIENSIHKDMKFRNSLKGMIIGQFTTEEYNVYTQNSSDLNKRMMDIVKERLKDNLLYFEHASLAVAQ